MIKFQGTRQDFGYFLGQQLRDNHHSFFSWANQETLRRQLRIYEKFYPELIEETIAIANYLGRNPDLLLYEYLASTADFQRKRVLRRTDGCTIFAIHEGDKTFVGRNYDWLPEARQFFERYDLSIKGVNRYFAFTDEGVWGRHIGRRSRDFYVEDALNEYGLYIGLTFSYIKKWNYGLSPSHMIRYVAEHCKTTRQALNAFAKIPCAVPKNFLIADAKGDLAVVEHTARDFATIRPNRQGVLIHTNHCLSPKNQKIDHIQKRNTATDSFLRYEEAAYLIHEQLPNFQFTDLWRILRQSHYIYSEDTIWSLALELSEQRFNIYYDTAMGQKHTKFHF